jgi:hypothetical protein
VIEDSRPNDLPWRSARWVPIDDVALQHGDVLLRAAVASDAADLFSALDHDECWHHVSGRPATPSSLQTVI